MARLTRGAVDTAVDVLNMPLVTALLLVIGAIGLYVEISAPGIGLGGLVAGLSFTLFFWSRFLGGTAGWLEVILVLAGAVFLAVEIFVLPGFGIAGVTGLLLMGAGIVLASQNHLIPQSPRGMQELGTSLVVLVASGALSLVAAAVLSHYYGSIPVLNRLVLRAPTAAVQGAADAPEGKPLPPVRRWQAAVGDWGVAESPLRPAGKAIFGEEYLDVVTDGSYVERGTPGADRRDERQPDCRARSRRVARSTSLEREIGKHHIAEDRCFHTAIDPLNQLRLEPSQGRVLELGDVRYSARSRGSCREFVRHAFPAASANSSSSLSDTTA